MRRFQTFARFILRALQDPPATLPSQLPIFQDDLPIHDNMVHAGSDLIRFKGGVSLRESLRIEDYHIRPRTSAENTPVAQAKPAGSEVSRRIASGGLNVFLSRTKWR